MAFEIQTVRQGFSKFLDSLREVIQQLDKSVGDFQSDREVQDHELALEKFTSTVQGVSRDIFKLVDETGGSLLNDICEIDKNLIQETLNLSLDLDSKDSAIPALRPSGRIKRRDSEDTVDLNYGFDNDDHADDSFDSTKVKKEKLDWDETNGDAEDVILLKTAKRKRGRPPKTTDRSAKVLIKTKGLIKKRKRFDKYNDKRVGNKNRDRDDDFKSENDSDKNERSRAKPKRKYTKIMHSRFRCRICVKSFSSKAALKLHLKTSKHLTTLKKQKLAVQSVVNENEDVKLDVDFSDLASAMEVDEPPRRRKEGKNKNAKRYDLIPQECTLCSEIIKSRYLLKQHYIKAHPDSLDKNVCERCQKPFLSEEALKAHQLTHVKRKHCEICEKTFSSTSRYKEHLGTLSHYRRKQELVLKNAMEGNPIDDKEDEQLMFPNASRICSVCGTTFSSKTSLYNHMHAIHNTTKDYICDICGKSWNCRAKLSAHMDTHLKRYKCDICGDTFSRKRLRDSHRRHHTGECPFKCPHCPKKFREAYLLRKHIKTHSTARPHSCPQCDAKFKIKGHLDRHLAQVHSSYRPHKCSFCSETFLEKRHLQKHLFQHTGESDVRCEFCGKFLANQTSLNTHINHYHSAAAVSTNHSAVTFNMAAKQTGEPMEGTDPNASALNLTNPATDRQNLADNATSEPGIMPGPSSKNDLHMSSVYKQAEKKDGPVPLLGAFNEGTGQALFPPQIDSGASMFNAGENCRPLFPPQNELVPHFLHVMPDASRSMLQLPSEAERNLFSYAYERQMQMQ